MVTAQIKEHTVFVGNIPYGLTEEQIIHVLSQAGQVLNFRLVYDKDTGRPRGYGFAEFSDNDAAASAVRNLNNYETMGRHLRVDWSNDGPSKDYQGGGGDSGPPNTNGPTVGQGNLLPPLPPGAELPAGVTCPDAISRTLNQIPPPQLLDMLSSMKGIVDSNPQQATQLLTSAPQLSYAIFQSLLLLGLVDTNVLSQVVVQAQQSQQQAPPPVPNPSMPQPRMPHLQQPQFQQMPSAAPPVPQQPPPPYQQAPPAAPPQNDAQQDAIRQIMTMPQQQIDALDPASRAQVMAIRQQMGVR